MSRARITHNVNPLHLELEEKLAREWEEPQIGEIEPFIIEESERQQAPSHLYVVWGEWDGLSQHDRSKIIMRAYERVRGRNFALNVALAMGMTQEEAKRMGIEYVPLDTAA